MLCTSTCLDLEDKPEMNQLAAGFLSPSLFCFSTPHCPVSPESIYLVEGLHDDIFPWERGDGSVV